MKERIIELLYHRDPGVRLQGVELALISGEAPLTLDHAGAVEAPRGVHGALLRLLLEAPAELRDQVRALYLALDEEALGLLPRLPAALPGLEALHLLGSGRLALAPLADLPRLSRLVLAGVASASTDGLGELSALEDLTLARHSWPPRPLPDLRGLRRLRALRIDALAGGLDLLPEQVEVLHVTSAQTMNWVDQLARFPLAELSLPALPAGLSPADLPALRSLHTWTDSDPRVLGWPLERLGVERPTEELLAVLGDHPTLRELELRFASSALTPRIALAALERAEGLDRLAVLPTEYWPDALPWPPRARCSWTWLQPTRAGEGSPSPSPVLRRSAAAWWADGHRLALGGPGTPALSFQLAQSALGEPGALRHYEVGEALSYVQPGLRFLSPHQARTLQGALLAYGTPAPITPMAGPDLA